MDDIHVVKDRSSHRRCSEKKGVLRNFTKFPGKHLCQSLFFNKVAGLRPATLFKKRLWYRCFPVNFVKFLRTPFLLEHLWWLLLHVVKETTLIAEKKPLALFLPYLRSIPLETRNSLIKPLKNTLSYVDCK